MRDADHHSLSRRSAAIGVVSAVSWSVRGFRTIRLPRHENPLVAKDDRISGIWGLTSPSFPAILRAYESVRCQPSERHVFHVCAHVYPEAYVRPRRDVFRRRA